MGAGLIYAMIILSKDPNATSYGLFLVKSTSVFDPPFLICSCNYSVIVSSRVYYEYWRRGAIEKVGPTLFFIKHCLLHE